MVAVFHDLHLLVALACQQYDVFRLRMFQRNRDGHATVGFGYIICLHLIESNLRFFDNCLWIFAAWVIGRQHHKIASFACGTSHQWTLLAIAIPAAAKKRDHSAMRTAL